MDLWRTADFPATSEEKDPVKKPKERKTTNLSKTRGVKSSDGFGLALLAFSCAAVNLSYAVVLLVLAHG